MGDVDPLLDAVSGSQNGISYLRQYDPQTVDHQPRRLHREDSRIGITTKFGPSGRAIAAKHAIASKDDRDVAGDLQDGRKPERVNLKIEPTEADRALVKRLYGSAGASCGARAKQDRQKLMDVLARRSNERF
jgi:hypothetical protein